MADENRIRADVLICEKGLAASRERAQALIAAGFVYAGGAVVKKSSQKLDADVEMEVRGEWCPYVSRGGFKLEKALKSFGVNPAGQVCIDIGASTGGFTDVLLQSGAKLVYAVDVGTDQLDSKLANDPRVVKMEQVNARSLSREQFELPPTLGVMDVSFISIRRILPALRDVLGNNGRLISLIKPQFEAGKENLGKKGIISNASVHEKVLKDVAAFAPETGWRVRAYDFSPISGTQGNLEFLAEFIPDDGTQLPPDPREIRELVKRAHTDIKKNH